MKAFALCTCPVGIPTQSHRKQFTYYKFILPNYNLCLNYFTVSHVMCVFDLVNVPLNIPPTWVY